MREATDNRIVILVRKALDRPVDSAWLATFRLLYGLALAVSMGRFLAYGWIDRLFVSPGFQFKYWGLSWVEPLPRASMHTLFWVLLALSLALALGLLFRLTASAFAVGLAYTQALDVSNYLNHYYLATLLAFLLAASPAGRSYSVDAWLRKRWRSAPRDAHTPSVGAGWLYLFRFQVGVVYVFAGLAKFQSDWLLHAQPLRIWLGANVDLPLLGPLFTYDLVPLAFSWFGFLFDTSVVAFLLWDRTRPWAYLVVIVFHVMTRVLFPIGMFPVIMVGAALVFFPPDWPRHLGSRLASFFRGPSAVVARHSDLQQLPSPSPLRRRLQTAGWTVAALYCAAQLALPLRHLGYCGNVLWHEQGMRFSWRVMLRAKGGNTSFRVRSKRDGKTWHVSPRTYLTAMQESEMSSQPDLILQLAHHIREDFRRRGRGDVEVRADSFAALNGRRSARLIDPEVDLSRIADGIGSATYVLPPPEAAPPHTRPVL